MCPVRTIELARDFDRLRVLGVQAGPLADGPRKSAAAIHHESVSRTMRPGGQGGNASSGVCPCPRIRTRRKALAASSSSADQELLKVMVSRTPPVSVPPIEPSLDRNVVDRSGEPCLHVRRHGDNLRATGPDLGKSFQIHPRHVVVAGLRELGHGSSIADRLIVGRFSCVQRRGSTTPVPHGVSAVPQGAISREDQ